MSWLDTLEAIRKRDFSQAPASEQDKAARDVINMCSYATAVVAVSPIPFSDALLMLPIQSAMVMTIGHIYGRSLSQADARELMLELGATAGMGFLARQGIKALLPIVGALLTIPAAFAATWGIGRVAMEYFNNPRVSREQLKTIFDNAKREASGIFSREAFDKFRRRNEDAINEVAEQSPQEAPSPPKRSGAAKKKAKAPSAKRAKKSRPAKTERSAAAIIEELIPAKLSKRKEVARRINALVHLKISGPSGGKWTVDLTKDEDWVARGLFGKPALTVSASDDAFVQVATGRQNAQTAVLSGTLKLEPLDLQLASAMGELFS